MIRTSIQGVKEKVASSKLSSRDVPRSGASSTSLTLETPVQYLRSVGPQRSTLFRRLGIRTLRDLLYHFPRRHEDRRTFLSIAQLTAGQKSTLRGQVKSSSLFRAKTGTVILQVVVRDESGTLTALWFNQPYMRRWFPVGQDLILYGTAQQVGRRFQMLVPEFELVPKGSETPRTPPRSLHMGRVVPIYPATSGLHQREFRTAVAWALKGMLPTLKDSMGPQMLERLRLPPLALALKNIHFPPTLEAISLARDRLTFDELFCFQLALTLRRKLLESRPGIAHPTTGDLVNRWRKKLPFTLTSGQEKAIQEIASDMASSHPMRRLLQGEVGSGKTVVAAYAIVVAVQNGFQVAVLAPTEVLARQHALTLTQLLSSIDVPVALLTSSLEESLRRQLARDLEKGAVSVLVGTHALLEPWVTFPQLGLVVIDEQQKFGVDQRDTIAAKGKNPDLLILTATPIPRTLALTLYGEMEISTITERPAGRQPVKTLWMDSTRREEVYAFVKKELDAGRQAYVVCPRIDQEDGGQGRGAKGGLFPTIDSAQSRWASATEMFQEYKRIFAGYRVALLHGRMTSAEQKAIFAAFRQGDFQVLVATQIIEVGVDVSNASVMVIESADRFGLSQLHQLRGRVGRGAHESTCILISDPKSPDALQRLETLVQTEDAFRIAEEDLRLRGPGQLLGKRQAGLPDLKCLEWATQGPWMELTKAEAQTLLTQDPNLTAPEHAALKKEITLRFPQFGQIGPCA